MCEHGKEQELVPLPPWIFPEKKNRTISVDRCIVKQLLALWDAEIYTIASCCGHNDPRLFGGTPSIVVADGLTADAINRAKKLLGNIDDRRWGVYQWRIVQA